MNYINLKNKILKQPPILYKKVYFNCKPYVTNIPIFFLDFLILKLRLNEFNENDLSSIERFEKCFRVCS